MDEKSRIRVMIADDESHIRLLIKTVMKSIEAEVVGEAQNGQEAVEKYSQLKPDITLLDINMPTKDGITALQEIMAMSPRAFVVMMTSVSDLETVERCLELGASHYIRKDTPIEEMKRMLKEAWDEYQQQ